MSDLDACDKGRQFCPQVVNGEFQREAMRHVLGKTLSNNLWFKFEISCLKIGKVLLTECYVYWMKHLLVSSNIFKLLTHILLTIWMRYLCSVIVSTEKLFWVLKWQKAKRTNTKWKLWQFSNNCWRKMKTGMQRTYQHICQTSKWCEYSKRGNDAISEQNWRNICSQKLDTYAYGIWFNPH